MSGDPKVLEDIQRKYLSVFPRNNVVADEPVFVLQREWEQVTGQPFSGFTKADVEIRAWTAPAEPSLEQRVAELFNITKSLDMSINAVGEIVDEHDVKLRDLEQHPEPTAPDDPVCARDGCGHRKSSHWQGSTGSTACIFHSARFHDSSAACGCTAYVPAPAAADLDPVLVAIRDLYVLLSKNTTEYNYPQSSVRDAWRRVTGTDGDPEKIDAAIRAYLNGGAS